MTTFEAKCPHCGQIVDCDLEYYQKPIQCPNCHQEFSAISREEAESIATPAPTPRVEQKIIRGAIRKIPNLPTLGKIIGIIGRIMILFSIITIIGLLLLTAFTISEAGKYKGSAVSDSAFCIIGILASILNLMIGVAIHEVGVWIEFKLACSICGNKIDNDGVKLCPVCRTELHGMEKQKQK